MNIYPAIKGMMGTWQYYIVKMNMRELADNVNFAADIYDDYTLDEAIQRVLNESRAKKDILNYFIRQPDHFISSLVVAALRGNPKWYPVTMEDEERFALFRDDRRLNDSFGLLSFDGTQDYYALDGQHRLAAIKALVDPNSDVSFNAPKRFKDEEVSVIVVVPSDVESTNEFMIRYRRLFGNLNRYAKRTDNVTNIIMDEDDAFAIITRRLITEHGFFQSSGKQKDSIRVKTTSGKNLRVSDPYFTNLEILYEMNILLLSASHRINDKWGANKDSLKEYKRFRPDDIELDALFDELVMYWDALIEELPILKSDPHAMRDHSAPQRNGSTNDNFLFWPIGQLILAGITRDLLDLRQPNPVTPSIDSIRTSIKGLSSLTWEGHQAPWRNLVLIPDEQRKTWKIRSEDRKYVIIRIKQIFKWQLGIDEFTDDEIEKLRADWKAQLLPAMDKSQIDDLWAEILSGCIR